MKRILSTVLVVLLCLGMAACGGKKTDKEPKKADEQTEYMVASWSQSYGSIEDLAQDANMIAVIKVEKLERTDSKDGVPYSVFAAKVLSPVYNAEEDQIVSIYMTGGPKNGKSVEVIDDPMLKADEEFLVFCKANSDGTYTVLGGPQGRFIHSKGKLSSMDAYNEQMSNNAGAIEIVMDGMELSSVVTRVENVISAKKPAQ